MTHSAARGGGHVNSPGGVGRLGDGATPLAGVSACVPTSRDAGGTDAHPLADTPQGDRTARRCTMRGSRLPVPAAMGDGPRRRHLACAITPAGGVPGPSPGRSVSRPPGHRNPRRLHRRWPGVARMGQPRRSGPWPRHTSTAMTAIVGGSSTVPAWLGGGIGPPGRSLSGAGCSLRIAWPGTMASPGSRRSGCRNRYGIGNIQIHC